MKSEIGVRIESCRRSDDNPASLVAMVFSGPGGASGMVLRKTIVATVINLAVEVAVAVESEIHAMRYRQEDE